MYDVLWYILTYSLLGWTIEVAYAACMHGKFINRGFLSGPVCPIYGFGVAIVYILLKPMAHKWLLLFIFSSILTTGLELITGFVLEMIFGHRWWDYSNRKFNIKGYVCLEFSVIWGFACIFVIKVLLPLTSVVIHILPHILGIILVSVLFLVMLLDIIYTVNRILGFNRDMKKLDVLSQKLKKNSEQFGEKVAENTIEAKEKLELAKEKFEESKEKTKEYKQKYDDAIKGLSVKYKRILSAFPKLKSKDYQIHIIALKKKLIRDKKSKL